MKEGFVKKYNYMAEFLNDKEKSTKEHREAVIAGLAKFDQIKKDLKEIIDAEKLESLCTFFFVIFSLLIVSIYI